MTTDLRPYLSPRRWRRLGLSRVPLVVEAMKAYRLYEKLESEPLPDMLAAMTDVSPKTAVEPDELVKVVDWVLHPTFGPDRCMPRTLVLLRLLARRGYDAVAVFGVAKGDANLQGHAWIELDGEPLAEHEDPRVVYSETFRFPQPQPTDENER